jgi:hypothetical protein
MARQRKQTKEEVLLRRVFKLISHSHFYDHKLSREYLEAVKFPRGLGRDIADFIQGRDPDYYRQREKAVAKDVWVRRITDQAAREQVSPLKPCIERTEASLEILLQSHGFERLEDESE